MPPLSSPSPSYDENIDNPPGVRLDVDKEASNEPFHVFLTYTSRPNTDELHRAFEFRKSLEFQVKNSLNKNLYSDLLNKFVTHQNKLGISEDEYMNYKKTKQEELYDVV